MRISRMIFSTVALVVVVGARALAAQTPARDPSERLKQVLPADVAAHVLATIAAARSHDLPAGALEQRALKLAARGIKPEEIQSSIDRHSDRLAKSKDALQQGRGRKPSPDEVEAGADALSKGVDGAKVSALAKSAPSGRSVAVPLYVIGSLVDRGLPSDSALARVQARLQARASDEDLERMPRELPAQAGKPEGRPGTTGQDLAATKRPAATGRAAGGPPAGVPANGGKAAAPPKGRGRPPA